MCRWCCAVSALLIYEINPFWGEIKATLGEMNAILCEIKATLGEMNAILGQIVLFVSVTGTM